MTTAINVERAVNRGQYLFIVKALKKIKTREFVPRYNKAEQEGPRVNGPQHSKATHREPHVNITLIGQSRAFPLNLEGEKGLFSYSYQCCLV